jgi:predicted AAA+ superfamily ATPase
MPLYNRLSAQADQLLLYRDLFEDKIGQTFIKLLRLYSYPGSQPDEVGTVYTGLFRMLTSEAEFYPEGMVGDVWQNHLLDRILDSKNPYSLKAGQVMAPSTIAAARRDLAILRKFFIISSTVIADDARRILEEPALPAWDHFNPSSALPVNTDSPRLAFKKKLAVSPDWAALEPELCEHYRRYGVDTLSRYYGFRWKRQDGEFEPIEDIDPIQLEDLIGYTNEQQVVVQNTEQFLAGLPANNVLLYGARGTGKSSTVKALLNRYAGEGLRLIEVHKEWLSDYPLIARQVRGRREKFIIFVDDLSFEETEVSYKDLKALLEGSIEARPANLLIYATSNRRHLIREQFSDNPGAGEQDEIAAWDTVEEKLSLSDRFGLMITFVSPSQQKFLQIVFTLAERAGIKLEREELTRRALQWVMGHSGRSGRVARQFIDHLTGQTALSQKDTR